MTPVVPDVAEQVVRAGDEGTDIDDRGVGQSVHHLVQGGVHDLVAEVAVGLSRVVDRHLGPVEQEQPGLLRDHPGNTYLANGFNNAGSRPYMPASGGLLWAAAMMAAGWEGGPQRHAPGFPDDGSWTVKWEGLEQAP